MSEQQGMELVPIRDAGITDTRGLTHCATARAPISILSTHVAFLTVRPSISAQILKKIITVILILHVYGGQYEHSVYVFSG